jgi:hypothetical protein
VTYRRNALGSARFYAPESILRRIVAIPDSHPVFDVVGLDVRALAQVRFLRTRSRGLYMLIPCDHS